MTVMEGRVALVTGASRGIGRAIAVKLAGAGATVVAAARGTNANDTVDEIARHGGRAEAADHPVRDRASLERHGLQRLAGLLAALFD